MNVAPSLECWIPASPNPSFYRMIRALSLSLRRWGGRVGRDAAIEVVFGDEATESAIRGAMPWASTLGVHWRCVAPELFARHGVYGTALARFLGPFKAPMVLMLDADVLITGSLDRLVRCLHREGRLGGLPAHIPPWPEPEGWERLFAALELDPGQDVCIPSGRGIFPESDADMPPYFNLGMILAPAPLMTDIGEVIFREMEAIDRVVDSHYRCQLALTAAILRLGIPWRALPLRYNFPNDPAFARRHLWERQRACILHYLRRNAEFDKGRDLVSPDAVRQWLARPGLGGINRALQRRIRALGPELGVL